MSIIKFYYFNSILVLVDIESGTFQVKRRAEVRKIIVGCTSVITAVFNDGRHPLIRYVMQVR